MLGAVSHPSITWDGQGEGRVGQGGMGRGEKGEGEEGEEEGILLPFVRKVELVLPFCHLPLSQLLGAC